MSSYTNLNPQYFDDNGDPLAEGSIEFFEPGTTGNSNRKDTYSDVDLTAENPNPVPLDSNGRPSFRIYLDGTYNTVIRDANGVQVDTVDNVIGVQDLNDFNVPNQINTFQELLDGDWTGFNNLQTIS